ncbi:DUF1566 domain-containing protein [bacterium]|nr:DUF1566 domain-containing protein [bacterium]
MRIKFLILFIISLFFLLSCDLNTKFDNPYDKNSEAYIPDNDSDSDETDDDSDKTDTEPGNDEDEKTDTDDSSDSGITDNDSTDTAPDQGDSVHDDNTDTGSDDSDTDTKPVEDTDTETDNESDEDEMDDSDNISGQTTLPECSASTTSFPCQDSSTGYIWSEKASGTMAWQAAKDHCSGLNSSNYGGYSSGWHLPNISELRTLIQNCSATQTGSSCGVTDSCLSYTDCRNDACSGCSSDSTGKYSKFGDTDVLWSSSILSNEYGYAWDVHFDSGSVRSNDNFVLNYNVRCVRNADGSTQITAEEECAAANGTWNSSQNKCTKTVPCSDKPANTVWNGESSYTQEYVSGEWTSSVNTVYSEDAGECHFKCVTDFFWNGSTCVNPCESDPCNGLSNSTEICSAISATNYSCGCENGYFWNGSACVNPCESAPCNGLSNSTGNCTAHSWQNYSCKCVSGYYWRGAEKGCIDKPLTLGNICTGLNKCYNESSEITCQSSSSDDFYGQDAHNSNKCVAQSFTLGTGAQAGTVIDNNTGLIWEQSPSSSTYTWANRATHCNELNSSNYAGINNWRVPNPSELLTIVDNSRYKPAINSNFTNIPDDGYLWTSTEYFGNTQYAYEFQTSHGKTSYYTEKTRSFKVLCVHGDIMSKGIFTTTSESGKEVVKDSTTGLMWQKESVSKSWREALKYCDDSNYANYSDWRLPNKNELASLLNYDKQSEPLSDFPDIQNNSFWSSSTLSGAPAHAVTLNFPNGDVGNFIKDPIYSLYVLCVRNAD